MSEPWRSPDEKPDPGLLCVIVSSDGQGKLHRVLGTWISRYTEEASPEGDFGEYKDDEDETWYCPEGWYEERVYGDGNYSGWFIPDKVVGWMPCPRYEP